MAARPGGGIVACHCDQYACEWSEERLPMPGRSAPGHPFADRLRGAIGEQSAVRPDALVGLICIAQK